MAKLFLIILAGLLIATVVCRPYWLLDNDFLKQFVNYEVLAIMAVILSITLASVASINLSLNQIVIRHFNGNEALKKSANKVKREMKDNAWYIFWGFVATVIILLVKGLNKENEMVIAVSNGLIIWVLFLFIACMLDIYKVAFGVVDLEMELGFSSEEKPSPKTTPTKKVSKKSPKKSKTKVPTP